MRTYLDFLLCRGLKLFKMEQYKDPRWQKRRLQIMERDKFGCQSCGLTGRTLNVHHFVYKRGKDIWDYKDDELITLCNECHEALHFLLSNGIYNMETLSMVCNLYDKYKHNYLKKIMSIIYSDK